MALFPVTLLMLSVYCLGLSADEATCPITLSLEDRLAKVELVLNDVKDVLERLEADGQCDCIKLMAETYCQNNTPITNNTVSLNSEGYKDCQALYDDGHRTSGVYTIKPDGVNEAEVYCVQDIYGGGWTVFQRRINGSQDFYLYWDNYTQGFGDVEGEYWLGNEYLHQLTANNDTQLLVELQHGNNTAYAHYDEFLIGDSTSKFQLYIGGFTDGTNHPGDSLQHTSNQNSYNHNGQPFSTRDHDNVYRCAQSNHGGWWYNRCYRANLNGVYNGGPYTGINWLTWKGDNLSGTCMMMKKR